MTASITLAAVYFSAFVTLKMLSAFPSLDLSFVMMSFLSGKYL